MADSVETNQQAAHETISVLVREGRTFPPPPEFTAQAIIKDNSVCEEAERDFEGFWLRRAKEFVERFKEPTQSLVWDPPHCSWFADTTTLRDPLVVEQLKDDADRLLGREGA